MLRNYSNYEVRMQIVYVSLYLAEKERNLNFRLYNFKDLECYHYPQQYEEFLIFNCGNRKCNKW